MSNENDKCVCGGYRKHHPSDRKGGGCKRFRLWKRADWFHANRRPLAQGWLSGCEKGEVVMGLARRRADLERMKRKAKRLYPHDDKARLANHLAACSCHMCGNPRRYYPNEKTMQERRADLRSVET